MYLRVNIWNTIILAYLKAINSVQLHSAKYNLPLRMGLQQPKTHPCFSLTEQARILTNFL